jgi:hypothetical protein
MAMIIALLGVAAVSKQGLLGNSKQLRHAFMSKLFKNIPATDRISLLVLVMVMSIYVAVAQLFASINYDTSLYHLPAVHHFLAYGPEIGLANFHFSLGFYNLLLFGQVAIQSLSPSRLILSPSLNIVFLTAFLLTLIHQLLSASGNRQSSLITSGWHDDRDVLRVLAFFLTSLVLGAQSVESLVSFNADFAVSLTTLSLVSILYFSRQPQLRQHALGLSLFLPLLKLSGMLGLVLIFLMEAFRKLASVISTQKSTAEFPVFKAVRRPEFGRSITALAVASYAIMILTNYILSGYLVFPEHRTGPLSSHAVPQNIVQYVKGALVTYYARSNDTGRISGVAFEQQWSLSQWLPDLLRTQRGQLMALWLIAAIVMALIIVILWLVKPSKKLQVSLLCLALAMPVIAGLALFLLPPNPRFFPWIGSLIGFEFAELVIFYPSIAMLAVTTVMAVITWRIQRPLLKSVGEVPYTEIRPRSRDIHGWKPRSRRWDGTGDKVLIRTPFNDKCWATESPCTPYLWFMEGKEPIRLSPETPMQKN